MARTKSGATSTNTKPKVAKVTGEVGRPNQSVAAIREQYKQEEERQKANFAKASEENIRRTLRDLTQTATTSSSLKKTDKDTIRGYLTGNIYSNSNNLIAASRYLYYRSPIYNKMINTYANMYCLDCRKITPKYTFQKGLDAKALKQYDETIDFLDILSLKNNIVGPMLNMWIQDISFNIFFHDEYGSMFWNIDPSEAVVDSVYMIDGGSCLGFAMDMSKWKTAQRQVLIDSLGEPLQSMWEEFQRTGNKYIHVPAEYSFVLKKSMDLPDIIIPPLLPFLSQLANLNDLVDSQASADELSFYRMIYLPLKTLNSAKNSDDWEITPDLAIDYFKIAAENAIPNGVSSAVIPGDKLETIDFSDNVAEDVNRVENSQQQILGGAGGVGALLNATKAVNNTELIKSALKAESAYVLSILGQIDAWTNLQLKLNLSDACRVSYLPVTIYTKEDYRKTLLEANQYSFNYRLAYGTLLGFTERETVANLQFENQILGLPEQMVYPLQSSYTTSNDGTGEAGRPEKDTGELSPSGERSRNQ